MMEKKKYYEITGKQRKRRKSEISEKKKEKEKESSGREKLNMKEENRAREDGHCNYSKKRGRKESKRNYYK
jgi:hypothetical protein